MRVQWQAGLLLTLSAALIGCNKSGGPAGKAPSAGSAAPAKSAPATAGASECIVGVNEMS